MLGFGRGNLDDAIMQSLAQNGNGTAAYIDTLSEARKVLVDQLTGALFPIADDVKIQVEWNPAAVAEYRLIGYETRALRREDFNNDAVDAGEIGAGTPGHGDLRGDGPGVGCPAERPAALWLGHGHRRRGRRAWLPAAALEGSGRGGVHADRNADHRDGRRHATRPALPPPSRGSASCCRGRSIWATGAGIRRSRWPLAHRGEDAFGYRIEAVNLMRLAQSLSAN